MWAHSDAKGFNLRLDYLPLNDAQIVIRAAGDQEAEGAMTAQAA
jgi:hypothetical protein